jgi:hypothetical protein
VNPADVARALYMDAEATRFYLIPDGVFLPEGPVRLRSMSGGLRAIDPDHAGAYAIDEGHARRLMKGAITGALGDATRSVAQLGILLATFGKAAEQPIQILDEQLRDRERAARVAEILGIDEAEAADRESVRLRLAELLKELETEIRHRDDAFEKGADMKDFQARFDVVLRLASEEVAAEYDPFAATIPLALREAFQSRDIQHQLKEVKVALHALREGVESMNDLEE